MSEGWISLHRGWRDNPIFRGEFSRADAWVWLIENACWKATRFDINGKTVLLERGQVCASIRHLGDAWGWSKSAVDRFLARLETETMIEREAGHGKLILTVCNYAKYQDRAEAERDTSGTVTGTRAGHERDTKEQGNKGISDEVAKATPSPRAKRAGVPHVRMTADWLPGPLPADVADLVAQWPPGRLEREAASVRDYWLGRQTKRPGWDLTFHNRIRDIHDRVLRDAQNGQQRYPASADRRDGIAKALDRRLGFGEPAREAGRCLAGPSDGDSGGEPPRLAAVR